MTETVLITGTSGYIHNDYHQNAVTVIDSLATSDLKLYDYFIHTEKMHLESMWNTYKQKLNLQSN